MPRNFINWSCKLTLCQRERDGGGGQPLVKSEVTAQSNKVGRLWFFGGRCSRIFRGTPEAQSRLCICRNSFLMTFVMSGVPLTSSQQALVTTTNSYPTLCDPMDYSPPGSSIHGILQARILEWVAIPFSRGSSQPKDQTRVSCIIGRFFYI